MDGTCQRSVGAGARRRATRPARAAAAATRSVPSSRLPPWKAMKPTVSGARGPPPRLVGEELGEAAHALTSGAGPEPEGGGQDRDEAEGEEQPEARGPDVGDPGRIDVDQPVTVSTTSEPRRRPPPHPALVPAVVREVGAGQHEEHARRAARRAAPGAAAEQPLARHAHAHGQGQQHERHPERVGDEHRQARGQVSRAGRSRRPRR